MRTLLTVLLVLMGTTLSFGQQTSEEKVVIETLNLFHQAITENNTERAQNLLSDSVRILEGGNIETKEEYLSHHFHSDGKFLSAMKQEVESRATTVEGNVAWVSTKTHVWGAYNERELNLNSLELTVLKKADGMWKISALHWSSSSRK